MVMHADLRCGDDEKHDVPRHLPGNRVPARPCVGLLSWGLGCVFCHFDHGWNCSSSHHFPTLDGIHRSGSLPNLHWLGGLPGLCVWMALNNINQPYQVTQGSSSWLQLLAMATWTKGDLCCNNVVEGVNVCKIMVFSQCCSPTLLFPCYVTPSKKTWFWWGPSYGAPLLQAHSEDHRVWNIRVERYIRQCKPKVVSDLQ